MAPIWLKVNLMIINKSLPRRYLWTDIYIFFTELFTRETSFINKLYTEDILILQCLYVHPSVHPSVLTAPAETF